MSVILGPNSKIFRTNVAPIPNKPYDYFHNKGYDCRGRLYWSNQLNRLLTLQCPTRGKAKTKGRCEACYKSTLRAQKRIGFKQ